MKLTTMVITLILSVATAFGAQEKTEGAFWGTLQGKVQKLSSSRKITTSAAVAGVKGAKNDQADIYWKGREKKVETSDDELQKFTLAMEYQSGGKKELALKHFDAFLKEFPNSPLHAEATQAVQLLKTELNPQPPVTSAAMPAAAAAAAAAAPSPGIPVPISAANPAPAAPAAK